MIMAFVIEHEIAIGIYINGHQLAGDINEIFFLFIITSLCIKSEVCKLQQNELK
jgi:hypothetical protein